MIERTQFQVNSQINSYHLNQENFIGKLPVHSENTDVLEVKEGVGNIAWGIVELIFAYLCFGKAIVYESLVWAIGTALLFVSGCKNLIGGIYEALKGCFGSNP